MAIQFTNYDENCNICIMNMMIIRVSTVTFFTVIMINNITGSESVSDGDNEKRYQ